MIVRAKLLVPPVSKRHVSRQRIVDAIRSDDEARLVTLVAPAGYGKSSVLAELLGAGGGMVGLDSGDDDPSRFWAYVGHALHDATGIETTAMADALLEPGAPSVEVAIAAWSNALLDAPRAGLLALDDLHRISDRDVLRTLERFIERMPAGLQLVISSRTLPPLPLARWRAAGELHEIDAEALRLDKAETTRFFDLRLANPLPARHVDTLRQRTEGWAVGLQLAAVALSRQPHRLDDAVDDFGGQRSEVEAYLAEQIVAPLPSRTRQFLLDVSVLDVLTPDACTAVTDDAHAGTMLAELERDNLPLRRLGAESEGYRLHHLLAEHLRGAAARIDAARARRCHRRAAAHAERGGDTDAAFVHHLAAADTDAATALLERRAATLLGRSRPAVVLRDTRRLGRGLAELPNGLLLHVAYSAYLCIRWTELRAALTVLHGRRAQGRVDEASWANVCNLRSALARAGGDYHGAIARANEGLALQPEAPGALLLYRSVAELLLGDIDAAESSAAECLATEPADGAPSFVGVTAQSLLAQVRIEQGRLGEAASLCEAARQRLHAHGQGDAPMVAVVDRTEARIHLERGAWERADAALTLAHDRAAAGGLGDLLAVIAAWQGQWALLVGDDERLDAALTEMQAATGRDAWLKRWHAALVGRRALAQGRPIDLGALPSPADEAWAMVELRRRAPDSAQALGERLRDRLRAQGRLTAEISIEVALAERAATDGRAAEADRMVTRAVRLAASGGLVRPFAEADLAVITALVVRTAGNSKLDASARRHAIAVRDALGELAGLRRRHAEPEHSRPSLSARELEVLSLLATGASNQQLATQLSVSLSTIKTHLNHIFDKLGVRRRTRAVALARELGLI